MSAKKRTTVTTIETHEVWIIRRAVPDNSDDAAMLLPTEIVQLPPVSTLSELNNSSQTIEEEEP